MASWKVFVWLYLQHKKAADKNGGHVEKSSLSKAATSLQLNLKQKNIKNINLYKGTFIPENMNNLFVMLQK